MYNHDMYGAFHQHPFRSTSGQRNDQHLSLSSPSGASIHRLRGSQHWYRPGILHHRLHLHLHVFYLEFFFNDVSHQNPLKLSTEIKPLLFFFGDGTVPACDSVSWLLSESELITVVDFLRDRFSVRTISTICNILTNVLPTLWFSRDSWAIWVIASIWWLIT